MIFIFQKSDPVVCYMETVDGVSPKECLAKTTNKHNRIYMTAEPLSEPLAKDIEDVRSAFVYFNKKYIFRPKSAFIC